MHELPQLATKNTQLLRGRKKKLLRGQPLGVTGPWSDCSVPKPTKYSDETIPAQPSPDPSAANGSNALQLGFEADDTTHRTGAANLTGVRVRSHPAGKSSQQRRQYGVMLPPVPLLSQPTEGAADCGAASARGRHFKERPRILKRPNARPPIRTIPAARGGRQQPAAADRAQEGVLSQNLLPKIQAEPLRAVRGFRTRPKAVYIQSTSSVQCF